MLEGVTEEIGQTGLNGEMQRSDRMKEVKGL